MPTAPTMTPPIPAGRTVPHEETPNRRVSEVTTQSYRQIKPLSLGGCEAADSRPAATNVSRGIAAMTRTAVRGITCRRVSAGPTAQQPFDPPARRRGAVSVPAVWCWPC